MKPSLTPEQAPPRVRRAQIVALTLLMVSGIVNYLDRGTLAVANPLIRKDLGLSLGEMGLLLSAFSWSYALFQLPVGGLVDRIGPRRLLGIGLIVWSLAQAAGGLVSTFGWFIVARIVLGIGESPQFPSAARVVSNWFPLRSRGKPTGIFNSASPLGTRARPTLPVDPGRRVPLALGLHRHRRARPGRRGDLACRLSRPEPVGADGRGSPLSAGRHGKDAGRRTPELRRLACPVLEPDHLGHADRLLRFGLPELGLPDLAARLSDHAAPHDADPYRHGRLAALLLRLSRRTVRRLVLRPHHEAQHLAGGEPAQRGGDRDARHGGHSRCRLRWWKAIRSPSSASRW